MKYTCLCCGYRTIEEKPPGTYEICNICYWEDDEVQFNNPDFEGGANEVSLRQAQKNFIAFGACEECFVKLVRKPTSEDVSRIVAMSFCEPRSCCVHLSS
ncbi:CPCC family cysteine-rich protein [Bacillus sp. MHSD17]|nr:CPCC family cysteine-rich protein [Bacillus sp. MHSD17]